MNREPVTIEKRRPLTRREVMHLMVEQGGRCKCPCGEKLQPMTEGVTDEHRIPLAMGGSNDLANRELWRTPCSKAKTAGKDQPAIAKVKRIEARENGTRRERKPIPARANPWPPKGSHQWGRKRPTAEKPGWPGTDDGVAGGSEPVVSPPLLSGGER